MSVQPQGRSLLQSPAAENVPAPIMFNVSNNPCIMLWAQNLNISISPDQWIDLAKETPTFDGSLCNETNSV